MSAAVACATLKDGATAKDHAAMIAEHFRLYNEEFGRITRRAALNFLAEDWHTAQLDAVARIFMSCVSRGALRRSPRSCNRNVPTRRIGPR